MKMYGTIPVVLSAAMAIGLILGQTAVSSATEKRAASKAGKIVGVSAGPCRVGFDTRTGTLTPPDDSTSNNVPAASVDIGKPCVGEVIGTFSSEVFTSGAGSFIHIDMRATCIGTGGFSSPCTVGTQVFASPGHTFFQNNVQPGAENNSVTMVWNTLPRGIWRFEVLPGGNGTAFLDFRAFEVSALKP
jgi:hypothetical protein